MALLGAPIDGYVVAIPIKEYDVMKSQGTVRRIATAAAMTAALLVGVASPAGAAELVGTRRNDNITGTAGDDVINARGGNDQVRAGNGNDVVNGGGGRDTLRGERGRDKLRGGGGNDILIGGLGNDILNGGPGRDSLYGNAGNDRYVINAGGGRDTISDFGVGQTTSSPANEGSPANVVNQGNDIIKINKAGFASFDDIAPLIKNRRTVNGNRTIIDLGDGDKIILTTSFTNDLPGDFIGTELTAANFRFASA